MKYKVSVVMPVYNSKAYLEEAINSVLKQTFKDFEFLIIDDGSTDDTVNRIQKFTDSRIRLFQNKHNFIETLNIGLCESTGQYIARMDADDIMEPTRLNLQFLTMEEHPDIAVCSSWFRMFGDVEKELSNFKGYISNPLIWLLKDNIIAHPTVMLRKNFLLEHTIKYENYPYAEDYKLWSKIAEFGGRFWVIPEYLMKYRISSSQISQQKRQEQIATSYLIKNDILNFLVENLKLEQENITKLWKNLHYFHQEGLLSKKVYFNLFFNIFSHLYPLI